MNARRIKQLIAPSWFPFESWKAAPPRFIAELAPADSEPEKLPFDQWVVR